MDNYTFSVFIYLLQRENAHFLRKLEREREKEGHRTFFKKVRERKKGATIRIVEIPF